MKSNYKKLGAYIKQVDIRNTNSANTYLRGVSSVYKCLMKSKANLVGTDMSTYKLVKENQFVFNPNTARMGDKIPIALNESEDCIVSQIYPVFEILNHDELNPEYLMMWFKRPEFDRYARFKSHGSAREIFDWEQMCGVELPVPHINKQREIVKEYNVVKDRIELNNKLIQKLEETAQAIYKQWFVDFEFPDENGKPYKSSGGEMVWCEELEKEMPKGWEVKELGEIVNLSQGIQVEVDDQFLEKKEGLNRFLRIIDYTPNSNEPPRYVDINNSRYFCSKDEVAMIRYGDAGTVCRRLEGIIANNLFKIVPDKPLTNNILYYFLSETDIQRSIRTSAASSTMPAITHTAIKELKIIYSEELIKRFDEKCQSIEDNIISYTKQTQSLQKLKSLLLAKMAK